MKHGLRFAVGMAIALGGACESSTNAGVPPRAQPKPQRGHDPWVFRSVLDERPGMLSAALRPELWVAYDTRRGSLYRVWEGGVNLDGAVYNTHHGPQPRSQGRPIVVSAFEEPWHVLRAGEDLRPSVRYRGHRLQDGKLSLSYALALADGTVIEVEERPEAHQDAGGRLLFERTFTSRGMPADVRVVLDFNAPTLISEQDVRIARRDAHELIGKLTLQPGRAARLVLPALPSAADTRRPEAAEQPAALKSMAESDCAACHSPTSRTVGPSYKEIAARYRTNAETIAGLGRKIRQGGGDEWGDAAMIAHPTLEPAAAEAMAEYILTAFDPHDAYGTKTTHALSPAAQEAPGIDKTSLRPGVAFEIYQTAHPVGAWAKLEPDTRPNAVWLQPTVSLQGEPQRRQALGASPGGLIVRARGVLQVARAGEYEFRFEHDGPAELFVRDDSLLRDEVASERRLSPWASIELDRGLHSFELFYLASSPAPRLQLRWRPPGGEEQLVPASALLSAPVDASAVEPGNKGYRLERGVPGDRRPLTGVHPSFALSPARPQAFKPMVGGMDFLPDGRLAISTWDARGAVYVLGQLDQLDPERITVTKMAEGLSEPLGLKVVDGAVYVLQKHELTKLVDHDRDGVADEYVAVSNGWDAGSNFHEFAFGLAYRDGHFYATLATAVEPGGNASPRQLPNRGTIMRIAPEDGAVEYIARGLRTPNGIGVGMDGELVATDNEGDWLPANKLLHVQEGAFYGSYTVVPRAQNRAPVTPPLAFLPTNELANSPTQPMRLDLGPYRNQVLYGDVTYGGLGRVVPQKIDGQYQGCVLPFTQGFEAGINRVVQGPDGAIYAGGIGNPGNWNQEDKLWYGLERLHYTGATTFEMLSLALRSDGIEISFTEPLRPGDGDEPDDYRLRQWHYVPTADYGGPKRGEHELVVRSVHVAPDRRRVFLAVDGVKVGHVVHVHLARPSVSEKDRELWATEAWCTINALPRGAPGDRFGNTGRPAPNTLSPAELALGFRLLFDGKTTRGWRNFRATTLDRRWRVVDGALQLTSPGGGDIVSDETFEDFELELEWKIARAGNSGIFYRVSESAEQIWKGGPEMQLLDDERADDRRDPTHRAGSAYDLVAPKLAVTRPAGQYNRSRLVVHGTRVEHWLNGRKVLSYDSASGAFRRRVAASKFADAPELAAPRAGPIGLQDHGSAISFRNIKVRPLHGADARATADASHARADRPN